jgi:hypothetical protein
LESAQLQAAWGVGLSHERLDIAGAEIVYSLEGNMCGTTLRGADAPVEVQRASWGGPHPLTLLDRADEVVE